MPQNIEQPIRRNSPIKQLLKFVYNIFLPPLAGRHHARYTKRPWYLFFDTLLALLILFLLGLAVYFYTSPSELVEPNLEVETVLPAFAKNNDLTIVKVNILNKGNVILSNGSLKITYPAGYTFQGAVPTAANPEHTNWSLGDLEPGQAKSVEISGLFYGADGNKKTVKTLVQYKSGETTIAKSSSLSTTISGSVLKLSLTGPAEVLSGGESSLVARLENIQPYPVVEGEFKLEYPVGFKLTYFSPKTEAGKTVWKISNLEPAEIFEVRVTGTTSLAPGKKLMFTGSANLISADQSYEQAKQNLTISVVKPKSIEELVTEPEAKGLQFAAEAHYYSASGIQFGYGPLPPVVGQETGYRIFWFIRTSAKHDQPIKVSASLPTNIQWAGNVAVTHGQPVNYNPATRLIEWEVGSLTESQNVLTASFEVILKPTRSDVGKSVELLFESTVQSDRKTIVRFPGLTTELSESQTRGKGKVIE